MSITDSKRVEQAIGRLALFEQGKLDLGTLVAELDFLMSALEDPALHEDLRVHWEVLEEVNADALDRQAGLTDHSERLIEEAINGLRERMASARTS